MHTKFFFQQNDTKINKFDEGVLILEPFYWGNVIQNLLLFYQKSRLRLGGISLSSFPGIVTLQSYVMNASFYSRCLRFSKHEQTLYPGEPNKGICGTSIVTFETEVANFENGIASEKRP